MSTRTEPGTVACPTCGAEPGQRCRTIRPRHPSAHPEAVEFRPTSTGYHQGRRDAVNNRNEPDRWSDFTRALSSLEDANAEHPGAWTATGLISFAVVVVGIVGIAIDDGNPMAWTLVTLAGCLLSLSWLIAGWLLDRWEL